MSQPLPIHYCVVLFPGFQPLDVFGPVGALDALSRKYPLELSVVARSLDPITTKEPGAGKFSANILPTHTFDSPPPKIDVLMVPGGSGTRNEELIAPSREFIAKIYPSVGYLFTVCTGSALVAQSGVLDSKQATTNKLAWEWATKQGPKVDWIRKARWVVSGNCWTTSGVTAGIDGILAFISAIYSEEDARATAWFIEHERHLNADDDPFC